MKQIEIKSVYLQNFKGCEEKRIEFGRRTSLNGTNAVGKTTIFDAVTWVLFNKDSLGNTKFDIRPLENGKMVDNIEISVEVVLGVDGEEYALKKVQKQKWVKKRGADTREFQGNINEFEINGYPKSEREFKEFVDGIVGEKLFNLLTNPSAFNALPWKEQREMLMKFVGECSDVELAEKLGEKFDSLKSELKIASTDDILKKHTKVKSTLNKQMVEIPARIDEVSKQLVHINVDELEIEKAAKEVAISKFNAELSGGTEKITEINDKKEQILNLKLRQSDIQNKANEELDLTKNECKRLISEIENEIRKTDAAKDECLREKARSVRCMESSEHAKNRYADEWKTEKKRTFPKFVPLEALKDSDMNCPTCGRELPEAIKKKRIADYEARCEAHKNKYEKDKAKFQKEHQEKLAEITKNGQKAADDVRAWNAKISLYEESIVKLDESKNALIAKMAPLKEKLSNMPGCADVTADENYVIASNQIALLESEIESLDKDVVDKHEILSRKMSLEEEIKDINRKIAAADNSRVEARISELEEEKTVVGQKIARTEQMIDLVEEFIRCKMNEISKAINNKFKLVSFKLFDIQINGGLKETCECTVNGVPLSSLNNGHRIIAGLDIINSLAELYGVNCPVFIDNAEAISKGNLPAMSNQVILLSVTEDKELKVEVESNE